MTNSWWQTKIHHLRVSCMLPSLVKKVKISLAWRAPGSVRLYCFNLCNFDVIFGGLEPLMPTFLSSGTDYCCRPLPLIACRQSRVKPPDYSQGPTGGLEFLFVLRSLHKPLPMYPNYFNHTVQLTLSGQIWSICCLSPAPALRQRVLRLSRL